MSKRPGLRALTCDLAGRVKVIEAKEDEDPKVVTEWGDINFDNPILGASFDNSTDLLAVSRKNGLIELMSSINGELSQTVVGCTSGTETVGLHLFKRTGQESSLRRLLTCTSKGEATLTQINLETGAMPSKKSWNVSSKKIYCSRVHNREGHCVFGGRELRLWDVEKSCEIWKDVIPPKGERISNAIQYTGVLSVAFQDKNDHRKIVTGTNNSEVRIYDTLAKNYAVSTIRFKTTPIAALSEDTNHNYIYCGNGSGDVACIDIRGGVVQEYFEKRSSKGEYFGNITSIARHPEHYVIASCGWNNYLRIWNIETSQLRSKVDVQHKSTNVVFDSRFLEKS